MTSPAVPYVFVDGPQPCYTCTEGRSHSLLGYHGFFVTYVPFVPSFLSDDFTRMIGREGGRIKLIVGRQIRFLNDLSSCRTGAEETFDLRFVSVPQPDQPYSRIYVFFVGKAFGEDKTSARANTLALWHRFRSYFPLEDPFNYPLRTIRSEADEAGRVRPSAPDLLRLALQPLSLDGETSGKMIEIRKYEDRDPMLDNVALEAEHLAGYYPHPFRPTLDFSAMSRFLETFAVQPQRCVASICLRPTALSLMEQKLINRMMDQYGRLLNQAKDTGNWLVDYRQERYDDLRRTFEPVINQRNHLFTIKIQVIGEREAPLDVVGALGSEIMNNSTQEPRLWSEVKPSNAGEYAAAARNFALMEYAPWARRDLESPLWRLSSLVTSYEAVGAFRLPVPPESGHMPGISVHDDPFVLPATVMTPEKGFAGDQYVPLGSIIHRGVQTATDFNVTLSQLKRHALVAGSTGSGKTNTCLHLLTQLWKSEPSVPFLVIYPIDKPDYRLLMADEHVRDDLLVFTVGDDTTSPFRFNPFAVPPGILVRTHMSLLMRAFTAAFTMWDPLPAVYRAALRRAYQEAGYHDLKVAKGGDAGASPPLLSRFYELLVETSEAMTRDYGSEARGNIRQGAEIRMRDLLQNAWHVLNVEPGPPWNEILERPTVMEIGRVGSTEDTALVMGFLLMSLTSHLASRRRLEGSPRQHITLIEEAHRLMSAGGGGSSGDAKADPRGQASEDFANMLAEVRGFGEGLMIAEQIPTDLVPGAIGNTYLKIMHWLEEKSSFDLFCDIMSLNNQQRDYARTLPTGQAILRDATGRPVLVMVRNYLDSFQHEDDTPIIDDSDEALRSFMQVQAERLGFRSADPIPVQLDSVKPREATALSDQRGSTRDLRWFLELPMQTCVFCPALHRTGKCRYGITVRKHFVNHGSALDRVRRLKAGLLARESRTTWEQVHDIGSEIEGRLRGAGPQDRRGTVYCVLAHDLFRLLQSAAEENEIKKRAEEVLAGFDSAY